MFKSLKGFLANSSLSPNSNTDSSSTNENIEAASASNIATTNPESSPSPNIATEGSSESPQSMTSSMYTDAAVLSDELKKSLNLAKGYLWNWGSSASKVATKAVKDVPILGDFQKEQEAFEQSCRSDEQPHSPPWVGFPNEEAIRKQILALSDEERNFLRNPPSGIQFTFDLKSNTKLALLMMKEDPKLSTMRFKLVPKRVKEDIFWRNYFYRVSLIKQSASMSTFAKQHSTASTSPVTAPSAPRPLSPTEASTPARASAATSALDLGLGGHSVDADPEADAEIAALSGSSGSPGASTAPVSLPPEELAQLGLVPKTSKEGAKEKEASATKLKSGSPSGSEAGNGHSGTGNGTESGSDWEKDLQRELETSTSPGDTDALGDDLLEKEILEQLEAERAAAKK